MIKAIVVDMDGTFLNDNKTYDREKFMSQYKSLKELGIKFIVASGNQYQHLATFFPDIRDEITFIAENGATIIHNGELIFSSPIPKQEVNKIFDLIDTNPLFEDYRLVMSGAKGGYIHKGVPLEYRKKADFFYQNIIEVTSYREVQDTIYKFAFNFEPCLVTQCEELLNKHFEGELKALTSGHEALDLVSFQSGKETGINILEKLWGIHSTEIAAFGDNINDLAMLQHVGYGYAVENGREEVKKAAFKIIGSNNQQAVLNEIGLIIDAEYQRIRGN